MRVGTREAPIIEAAQNGPHENREPSDEAMGVRIVDAGRQRKPERG